MRVYCFRENMTISWSNSNGRNRRGRGGGVGDNEEVVCVFTYFSKTGDEMCSAIFTFWRRRNYESFGDTVYFPFPSGGWGLFASRPLFFFFCRFMPVSDFRTSAFKSFHINYVIKIRYSTKRTIFIQRRTRATPRLMGPRTMHPYKRRAHSFN